VLAPIDENNNEQAEGGDQGDGDGGEDQEDPPAEEEEEATTAYDVSKDKFLLENGSDAVEALVNAQWGALE
jgi:hypothetical protein